MEHLPIEIVNQIMLYKSHPCADIIRNCEKPYDIGYLPMVRKLNSWYTTTKNNNIIRYEYNLIHLEIQAIGHPWGRPCVFCN
jgi:hypothetical protein